MGEGRCDHSYSSVVPSTLETGDRAFFNLVVCPVAPAHLQALPAVEGATEEKAECDGEKTEGRPSTKSTKGVEDHSLALQFNINLFVITLE